MQAAIAYYAESARSYVRVAGGRGLVLAAMAKLSGRERLITRLPSGYKSPIALRVPSSDVLVYEQVFVEEEYDIDYGGEPRVIVDAGANVGLASIYFANRFPGSRILAIEPDPGNFAMMKSNTAPYPQITPIHAALWNECGHMEVFDSGTGNWGKEVRSASEQSASNVRAVTVDHLMNEHALGGIDLLKVDIEGAEWEVFSGDPVWLDRVNTVVLEVHESRRPGVTELVNTALSGFQFAERRRENRVYRRMTGDGAAGGSPRG